MANTYLYRTPSSAGNRKTWTWSAWIKLSDVGVETPFFATPVSTNDTGWFSIRLNGNSVVIVGLYNTNFIVTNRRLRDTNGWYNICVSFDSTNSTASDRCKLFINGVRETSFANSSNPTLNQDYNMNNNVFHSIGEEGNTFFNGSMSHVHFIDGTAYDASAFGSFDNDTGEWSINTSPSVTYGTNGFFIFKDGNSVTDQSGNSNNFTVSGNLTKTEDNPSNVFCTNNSLWKQESSRYLTHTIGNTMISGGGSATWYQTPGTLAFNSGKFYWECKWNASTNLTQNHAGVIDYEKTAQNVQFRSQTGSVFFTNEDGGELHIDGPATTADYGTLAQNDILGVAVDMDATTPTVKFYKNGSLHASTNAASLAGKFVTPAQMIYQSGEFQLNFGNGYFGTTAVSSAGTNASGIGIFEYDVPTGYTALSTKGLNL